jgi:hypothetical protein
MGNQGDGVHKSVYLYAHHFYRELRGVDDK